MRWTEEWTCRFWPATPDKWLCPRPMVSSASSIRKAKFRPNGLVTMPLSRNLQISTPEAGRLSESDESQLQWAARQGRVLVSFKVSHGYRSGFERGGT
jgi:hypothetical protein